MKSPISMLQRLAAEPPFRLFAKHTLALLPCSVETRAKWDVSERPNYLVGTLFAAGRARAQRIPEISVIEFGVAGGSGLLTLQAEAEAVERATGVAIRVYGFDAGPGGLPSFCGDYRDHPDMWRPGDYPMDVDALRAKLAPAPRSSWAIFATPSSGSTTNTSPDRSGLCQWMSTFTHRAPPPFACWNSALSSGRSPSILTTSTRRPATSGPENCSPSTSSTRGTPISRSIAGAACGTAGRSTRCPGSTACFSATILSRSRGAT